MPTRGLPGMSTNLVDYQAINGSRTGRRHVRIDPMTIPESLLDILCCPVSHEPLRPLEKGRVRKLNDAIERGELLFVDGSTVDRPISEALITRDAKVVYVVDDGIPVLLPDRGIGTTQLESF